MAKANVNIENVDSFRQGIESQRDSVVDSVDTYNATIDETKESLTVEKEKTVTLIGEVQSTLSVLLSKIEEQRAKVEELQASLAALEASEPEEYETVYEPDVTDDEGNVISEGGSYEVETAAHIAWRNEVDKLSSELANEEDRLALMEEVESKLQAVASKLEEQQVKLDELYAELEGSQEEVNARRGEIESFSESAIEKLNKISSVLQEYLATTIGAGQSFWSKVIFPGVTVSGMSVGKFSVFRVATMTKAFDNAPDWIKSEVAAHGNKVKVKDKPCRSHYTPSEKRIYMDPRYDDDEYAEVFKHEFGHYIDHAHGWLSQSPAFVNAYRKDCENLDITTWDGAQSTNKMLTELMNGESAKYDRCISDILSATYNNDPLIENRYFSEGLSYYQHDNSYWARGQNRENEVFANLFAIYSNNDIETIYFISKHFPNTDKAFKNLLQ